MDRDYLEELIDVVLEIPPPPIRHGRGPARPRVNALTHFSDAEFRDRYRFDKDTVHHILGEIRGRILNPRNRRGLPLSPMDQLLIFLRFCATGCFQVSRYPIFSYLFIFNNKK
uniref:Uncharacterized protein n=1 Tax=Cacopsylla melanoneura TaxID=428564 RepID=A0A8D9B6G5_9HEMI